MKFYRVTTRIACYGTFTTDDDTIIGGAPIVKKFIGKKITLLKKLFNAYIELLEDIAN